MVGTYGRVECVRRGGGLVQQLPGAYAFSHQRLVPPLFNGRILRVGLVSGHVRLGLSQLRRIAGEIGFGSLDVRLVWPRVDGEEQIILFYFPPFREMDLIQ